MLPQIGEVSRAGLPVNQVDDECPHDRTPLLIGVLDRRCRFQDAFSIPKKVSPVRRNGFVGLAGGEAAILRGSAGKNEAGGCRLLAAHRRRLSGPGKANQGTKNYAVGLENSCPGGAYPLGP
jgi:hypothetical protein